MSSTSSRPPDLDLVEAVARRVVALLREEGLVPSEAPRLLTVAQVAREFGLSPDWIYGHARQLGAIRLGSGPRRACASTGTPSAPRSRGLRPMGTALSLRASATAVRATGSETVPNCCRSWIARRRFRPAA